MRNFLRNITDLLRGFARANAHDATGPAVNDFKRPIPDAVARLTPDGIRFNGLCYNSSAVAEMKRWMKSGDRVRVMIEDPSDASSILVWDSNARPAPCWITVGIADAPTKLSFAQHARLCDFASEQDLAFITEAQLSEAQERLRQHWEDLCARPPAREIRQARRHIGKLDVLTDDDIDLTDHQTK